MLGMQDLDGASVETQALAVFADPRKLATELHEYIHKVLTGHQTFRLL